jgi:hypothetical protein
MPEKITLPREIAGIRLPYSALTPLIWPIGSLIKRCGRHDLRCRRDWLTV